MADQGAQDRVESAADLPEEELRRAELYDFLAALLRRPPDAQTLQGLAALKGDDSDIGRAITALARLAKAQRPEAVTTEFNNLFIGLGRGELLPYASYYLTGFLHEKPLARLRADMQAMGAAPAPEVKEPEDHIAGLCEIMAGMILGRFDAPASLSAQRAFFKAHIQPWAAHFFSDLQSAQNSVFYAPIGALGGAFMELEQSAFRMEAAAS